VYLDGLVIQTKLAPLRSSQRVLTRPRLTELLLQALDYRLAILQAGAGYGKSTALAALTEANCPLVWHHLDREDSDPLVFLVYLLAGFRQTFPGLSQTPLALLEAWQSSSGPLPWPSVVDALVNELARALDAPTLLILDDAHLLNDVPESLAILERLIRLAPANLHILLSTRYHLQLESLVRMRVRGEVLEIGETELAFTPDEIRALFEKQYGLALTPDEVTAIARETEGWAIALHLIWQGLPHGSRPDLIGAVERLSGLKVDLFSFLAQEVLAQHHELQEFLLTTSVLRKMTPLLCDCLRGASDSAQVLGYLVDHGLFITELDDSHLRYQHLFHEFLYDRLGETVRRDAHLRAAACYEARGDHEEAVYHTLRGGAYRQAAAIIRQIGRDMVNAGRLETLAGWLGQLSPEALEAQPVMMTYMGDIARLHSRFDEALRWYQVAEDRCRARGDTQGAAQALRGQARIYLDTVNPSQAEHLLAEAIRLSDGQEDRETRANLLELLAENQLNLGRIDQARAYQQQAIDLREQSSDRVELSARVMLRTGRLVEACRMLEERARTERQEPVLRPRAHRETLLLLSLLQTCLGEAEAAYRSAVEGTGRGIALDSPFVTAVGYMRQGHAWLLRDQPDRYEQAVACFERTIAISEEIGVDRLKVEACWGLCRAYGYRGELARAEAYARQGIAIATRAGDEWITAQMRVAMGAAYVLAAHFEEAQAWLSHAYDGYRECGDSYGQTLARLWQSLVWFSTGDSVRLAQSLGEVLELSAANSYSSLLTRRVLGGPPDPRRLVPLLLFAREHGIQEAYAGSLLVQLGLENLAYHPGYQLRVQTLGAFRVWRGQEEVDAPEWQREKARQLFQLLITWRSSLHDRDKLCDILWPDMDAEAAHRGFKVALNALYNTLEPMRERGDPSSYVVRSGSLYGLRTEADIWIDAEAFEKLAAAGDEQQNERPDQALASYRQALALNQGDYLEEYLYDDWCQDERARLRTLYLRSADRAARILVNQQRWDEVIEICELMVARDDCWEQAYRLLMQSYMNLGNRAQAIRTYQRAVERLRVELDTSPSPETTALYQAIQEDSGGSL
jgi:ATP/maltotriose-dependent transcriptional regulator MalT/DNA-binding SARP family transcriptional activator